MITRLPPPLVDLRFAKAIFLYIAGKKINEDDDSSDDEQEYNYEKLKTFHIPRKKELDNNRGTFEHSTQLGFNLETKMI